MGDAGTRFTAALGDRFTLEREPPRFAPSVAGGRYLSRIPSIPMRVVMAEHKA